MNPTAGGSRGVSRRPGRYNPRMLRLRIRLVPLLAVLLLLPLADARSADPGGAAVKIYRKELGKVVAREKFYLAKGLDEDLREAYTTYRAPFSERGGPDAPNVIDYDFRGYDAVYERFAAYEREKGQLAIALALTDGEAVAEALVDTLLDVVKDLDALDRELLESRPKGGNVHDQTPGIRRYGARIHLDMLAQAIGALKAPEAIAYLADDGFRDAERYDRGKRTDHARIALLDALALTKTDAARARLADAADGDEPRLRIVGLEGLGAAEKARLEKARDGDPCYAVRAAARALLGEATPAPAADAPEFFDVPVPPRLVLILDTGYQTVKPVDVDLIKERSWREWRSVAEKDRNYVTQLELMKSETRELLNRLPEGGAFDLLLLGEGTGIDDFSPKEMAPATEPVRRRAAAFLDGVTAGGWAPQIEGLWEASRRAGVDPFGAELPDAAGADAIGLVSSGVPSGGPLMYGAALVDDVRRRHRFLRIPVVTVRVDDCAAPAEEVMKGIAEVTGGRYVHRTKP